MRAPDDGALITNGIVVEQGVSLGIVLVTVEGIGSKRGSTVRIS